MFNAREELWVRGFGFIPAESSFLFESVEAKQAVVKLVGVVDELIPTGEVEVVVVAEIGVTTADGDVFFETTV